ncbi:heparan-alpha-glucosaminide N-acetyltransferase domain-containing protein [Microbacterium sp. A93]|uniref:heparan-alpha-glucosaminide N-acetyltransferase domain-containing protein n=1 Tax=Microbacterium sp. A93 TaxID=3450716 RepID=UPI003F438892
MPEKVTPATKDRTRTRKVRIVGVDAARGLALVGMMAVHVLPAVSDDGDPTLVWLLGSGVAAALFAFLAGVSLSLSTGGSTPHRGRVLNGSRIATAVRAGILIALGLLLAVADPPAGIILAYYGAMFLMALPLLGAATGTLIGLAGVFAVIGSIFVLATSGRMPSLGGFDPSLTTLLTEPDATFSAVFVTGTYPALAWMTFICAGMAVGRLNLSVRDTQLRLVVGGLVTALVSWAVSTVALETMGGFRRILETTPGLSEGTLTQIMIWGSDYESTPTSSGWWLFALSPYSETPLEMLNVLGWAVAAFGAMLLVGSRAAWLVRPLALLGTMTLTLYSLHLLFISTHLLESLPYLSFWLQVAAGLLFVVLWRNISEWSQGPLEWVLATCSTRARDRFLRPAPLK